MFHVMQKLSSRILQCDALDVITLLTSFALQTLFILTNNVMLINNGHETPRRLVQAYLQLIYVTLNTINNVV